MNELKNLVSSLHNEEIQVGNYFKAHLVAAAIGGAVAAALVVFSVAVFFHI